MKAQISFDGLEAKTKNRKSHGGSLRCGKRKSMRPLDSKKALHLVLKATNSFTLLKNRDLVGKIIARTSHKFGIKLHSQAIQYDHIHLHLKFQNRKVYVMWIRALTGTLVRNVERLKFKLLPFTRIVNPRGNDFKTVQSHILRNSAEAEFLCRIHSYIDRRRLQIMKELEIAGFKLLMDV